MNKLIKLNKKERAFVNGLKPLKQMTCPKCYGKMRIARKICSFCNGKGVVNRF